jgi:hypothetical protein
MNCECTGRQSKPAICEDGGDDDVHCAISHEKMYASIDPKASLNWESVIHSFAFMASGSTGH